MEITVIQEQGRVPVTVLHLVGELTSEEPFKTRVREAHEAGARNILIDLSKVPYISSSGLRALHAAFTLLRAESSEESDEAMAKGISDGTFTSPHLKLLNPTQHANEVLKTAGYDMFLQIHHDYKKAIASF